MPRRSRSLQASHWEPRALSYGLRPGRLRTLSEMAPVDGNYQKHPGRSESCACDGRSSTMAAQGRDLR
jgi:hypothetical protein